MEEMSMIFLVLISDLYYWIKLILLYYNTIILIRNLFVLLKNYIY